MQWWPWCMPESCCDTIAAIGAGSSTSPAARKASPCPVEPLRTPSRSISRNRSLVGRGGACPCRAGMNARLSRCPVDPLQLLEAVRRDIQQYPRCSTPNALSGSRSAECADFTTATRASLLGDRVDVRAIERINRIADLYLAGLGRSGLVAPICSCLTYGGNEAASKVVPLLPFRRCRRAGCLHAARDIQLR